METYCIIGDGDKLFQDYEHGWNYITYQAKSFSKIEYGNMFLEDIPIISSTKDLETDKYPEYFKADIESFAVKPVIVKTIVEVTTYTLEFVLFHIDGKPIQTDVVPTGWFYR